MNHHPIHSHRRTCLRITATMALVLVGCHCSRLEALSLVYDQPTGNWNVAANWQNSTERRVPTADDTAFIRAARVVTVNTDVGTAGIVYLGDSGAQGTLLVNSGAVLSVAGPLQVMRVANSADVVGTLTMNGGTLSANSMLVGTGGATGNSSGTVNISGGTLTAPITVGSTSTALGYFNVFGSTALISGSSFTATNLGRVNFAFSSSGVSMLNYSGGAASFAANSLFSVDGSLYTGIGGDFTLVDSSTLSWNVNPGNVSITGFNGYTTQLLTANNDVILRLTAVPEPSAYLMIATLPLLGLRRKRRPFTTA